MADRRRAATIRTAIFGSATAVLVFAIGTPAIVSADGGQTELIHACLLPDAVGPNVMIVGPNESCPGGNSPLHWPATTENQPEVESPEIPPPSEQSTQAPPKVKKKLYGPAGIRLQKTKTVSKTLGPSQDFTKDLTVSCTASHPYAVTGYSEVLEPQYEGKTYLSHAVAWHAWRAVQQGYQLNCFLNIKCVAVQVPWTMKLTVTCAMVKTFTKS